VGRGQSLHGFNQDKERRFYPGHRPRREAAFKQGDFLVFEVSDEVARYWNKTAPGRREELWKQSKKDKKDLREVVEGYVFRPAHTK